MPRLSPATPSSGPGMPAGRKRSCRRRQRGVATLLVVMVLLFVISLVAAYTGRNMLFEQRTSANYLQSTVSFEAAEAGLEWALAMLNSGRIDDSCSPSVDPAQPSFRQRYLSSTPTSERNFWVPDPVRNGPAWPSCVSSGTGWQCSCPTSTAPVLAAPTAGGLHPAFRIRFMPLNNPEPLRPGMVRIEVKGCTQLDDVCLNFPPANFNQCTGTVCATVALSPALKIKPVAALTARRGVDVGALALTVVNDSGEVPVAVHSGALVVGTSLEVRGRNGLGLAAIPSLLLPSDSGLADPLLTADRMFAASFGSWREIYREQPAAVAVDCSATCSSTAVRAAWQANPERVLLLNGDVALDGGPDIGSPTLPVALIVRGNLSFAAATTVHGLVYAEVADWAMAGVAGAQIIGAAVAEGSVSSTSAGALTIARDDAVLDRLRWRSGSFVRVPGGWRDFQ